MQLGPGTASLACARLIVLFAPFSVTVSNIMRQVTVLPFFTVNLHYCTSGRCTPFLQQ